MWCHLIQVQFKKGQMIRKLMMQVQVVLLVLLVLGVLLVPVVQVVLLVPVVPVVQVVLVVQAVPEEHEADKRVCGSPKGVFEYSTDSKTHSTKV